jgi:NAD(P)-dependent dehydrogenase (short-subunit alcohol dehydrogenase family)
MREGASMSQAGERTALIVGVGPGLSASLARLFAQDGYRVVLAARSIDDLEGLCAETGAKAIACDAADPASVESLFTSVDDLGGNLDVAVFNAGYRTRGPLLELDPAEVEKTLIVSAFAGFLVGQQAAKRMVPRGEGAILFTGASASVKAYPGSAPFAMGKFALRGLAQSMARELAPKGVHVAHFVIDGGIRSDRRPADPQKPDAMLDPDAIAASYMNVLKQNRSAWTWELELRPWVETF